MYATALLVCETCYIKRTVWQSTCYLLLCDIIYYHYCYCYCHFYYYYCFCSYDIVISMNNSTGKRDIRD